MWRSFNFVKKYFFNNELGKMPLYNLNIKIYIVFLSTLMNNKQVIKIFIDINQFILTII